jgi:hypothetical protein
MREAGIGKRAAILSRIPTIEGNTLTPYPDGFSSGMTAVGMGTGVGSAATSTDSESVKEDNLKDNA